MMYGVCVFRSTIKAIPVCFHLSLLQVSLLGRKYISLENYFARVLPMMLMMCTARTIFKFVCHFNDFSQKYLEHNYQCLSIGVMSAHTLKLN